MQVLESCSNDDVNNKDAVDDDILLRPFEWLTSSTSLKLHLLDALHSIDTNCTTTSITGLVKVDSISKTQDCTNPYQKSVLHVGCGSSLLGEHLLEDLEYNVQYVLNVDSDDETLQRMKRRWESKNFSNGFCETVPVRKNSKILDFQRIELSNYDTKIDAPDNFFDMIVDKSTLDCLLCSPDEAVAALLTEAYRLLKPDGGVYLIVSFQSVGLLLPLLQDLPNADWDVSIEIMNRQSENLEEYTAPNRQQSPKQICTNTLARDSSSLPVNDNLNYNKGIERTDNEELEHFISSKPNTLTWDLDDNKYRTVKIVKCRRSQKSSFGVSNNQSTSSNHLEWEKVCNHIRETNDLWFQQSNPFLTDTRIKEIYHAFSLTSSATVPLVEAYEILFSEEEKVHYLFKQDFLQDWYVFFERNRKTSRLSEGAMSVETAIAFLKEVQ